MAKDHPDDDATFEGALARGLRDVSADGACPDAEVLALMVERSLEPVERRSWDAHVSTCARCQAHLAALVRTAGEPDHAAGNAVGRKTLAWVFDWRVLVPLATTAAVVLSVWSADPNVVTKQTAQRAADRTIEALAEEPAATAPEVEGTLSEELQDADAFQLDNRARPTELREQARDEPAIAETAEVDTQKRNDAAVDRLNGQLDAAAERRPVPPAELETERAELRATSATAAAPPQPAQEQVAKVARSLALRSSDALRERAVVAAETVIRSPDGQGVWRLTQDGHIDRAADAGVAWVRQHSEAPGVLRAGSAPSNSVCWVVGAAGTILRTTDSGASWVPIAAPQQSDLVNVSADDAETATVQSQDGSRFRTETGGATWSALR